MADQVPTIASFPAGYATLAGCLYAVFMTDRSKWDLVVWSRISRIFEPGPWRRGVWTADEDHFERSLRRAPSNDYERLVTVLSKCITKHARHVSGLCAGCRTSENRDGNANEGGLQRVKLAEWAAALSIVLMAAQASRQSLKLTKVDNKDSEPMDEIELRTQTPQASGSNRGEDRIESSAAEANTIQCIITVEIVDETKIVEKHRLVYTKSWISSLLSDNSLLQFTSRGQRENPHDIWQRLSSSSSPPPSHQVSVQIAANVDIFMVELAFKFLEILFAGAIVLGSTAGAWLGLTLSSLFPSRRAAGIFTSAYGQVNYSDKLWPKVHEGRFVSSGTVWCSEWEIAPRGWSDDMRIMVGYAVTYVYLTLIQLFKPSLRLVLDFGNYYQTKDAIRWVLLFLQLFVAGFLGRQIVREFRMKKLRLNFLIVAVASYIGCNVIVLLAQKTWGPFHLLSKVVDPAAVVGCLAASAMRRTPEGGLGITRTLNLTRNNLEADVESGGSSFPDRRPGRVSTYAAGSWILMWAIGACTAVY